MRPEFSEFSYGYALTEALVNGQQHLARPVFPTQRQEWYDGYDMRLDRFGYPIFLQFKLCHGMTRGTAQEIARFQLPLDLPYLRMPLMPGRKSPQHVRLMALEGQDESVFYAAPRFFRDHDFAAAYGRRAILSHSAFIRPSTIGPLSGVYDHHVAFDCNARHGWLLSEPKPLAPILDGDGFQEEAHLRLRDERPLSDAIHAALLHVTDTIIGDSDKPIRPLAVRGILLRLCLVIRRVYPDFPEADAILDTSARAGEQGSTVFPDFSERLSMAFRRELERMLDYTDAPGERVVALLSMLAQIYLDATVVLITHPAHAQESTV